MPWITCVPEINIITVQYVYIIFQGSQCSTRGSIECTGGFFCKRGWSLLPDSMIQGGLNDELRPQDKGQDIIYRISRSTLSTCQVGKQLLTYRSWPMLCSRMRPIIYLVLLFYGKHQKEGGHGNFARARNTSPSLARVWNSVFSSLLYKRLPHRLD